jgi:hypothetical protein
MTVSGVGSGEDRFQASEMARIACQGQALAMGGATVHGRLHPEVRLRARRLHALEPVADVCCSFCRVRRHP